MLQSLHISNFALIDSLDTDFTDGFSSITGETGAGKSIILGAIDLLRGKRAETRMLRHKDKKAVIEATFNISKLSEVKNYLQQNNFDLPTDDLLLLRRDISPTGRSRAFINDTPANLSSMEKIAGLLIDVHSQHQTQAIVADPKTRLKFIDALDSEQNTLQEYKLKFHQYVALRNQARKLRAQIDESNREKEALTFKYNQLAKLNPKKGEQKQLEKRFKILSDSEHLKETMEEAMALIHNRPDSALPKLENALSLLSRHHIDAINHTQAQGKIGERLGSIIIELKDLSSELDHIYSHLFHDPDELQKVEQRLNDIYEAQLDFGLKDADQLAELMLTLQKQLKSSNASNDRLNTIEAEMKTTGKELQKIAEALTMRRKTIAASFSLQLQQQARELGLPNLKFEARVSPAKLSAEGADQVDFLCAFNKNQDFMELQLTASGGEASRLMLCMKGIIAGKTELPTIIFDEIDTGISGEIASKAGKMMRSMGKKIQVMAITHLPQVAASAANQYKVYKTDNDKETTTSIQRLTIEQREMEIAKMLSGAVIDKAAINNAKVLLKEGRV